MECRESRVERSILLRKLPVYETVKTGVYRVFEALPTRDGRGDGVGAQRPFASLCSVCLALSACTCQFLADFRLNNVPQEAGRGGTEPQPAEK